MNFEPNVGDAIIIGGYPRTITQHPGAPGMPYGQMGRAGMVFQLRGSGGEHVALKVFNPAYRHVSLVDQSEKLRAFGDLPGLAVCHRAVLRPGVHDELLQKYPDLLYAVLMPWIEGTSWSEIVRERRPLTHAQSHGLAVALLGVLVRMGQEGVAHGDLSGANLMIDGLDMGDIRVELVDVEQLYASSLSRPAKLLKGTDGYAHKTSEAGLWQPEMDRFAGNVLLAEILGWCDARVRAAADAGDDDSPGETYFAKDELQQDCERYRLLHRVLGELWGEGAAALLAKAWQSETLAQCPPFAGGQMGLAPPPAPPTTRRPPRDNARDALLVAATTAERAGRLTEAANAYEQLALGWPHEADSARWLSARDRLRRQAPQAQAIIVKPKPARQPIVMALVIALFVLLGAGGIVAGVAGGREPTPTPTIQATAIPEILPMLAEVPTSEPEPTGGSAAIDTDGDGLTDEQEEQNYRTDPRRPDTDDDGLPDGQEAQNYSTDPNDPDTDKDGLVDGQEVQNYNTDPRNPDSDGDGLTDGQEVQNYHTDPNFPDTDDDGLTDAQEIQIHNTNPLEPDTDRDSLGDRAEIFTYRTDPNRRDSDGDGKSDGSEVSAGAAPLQPEELSPVPRSPVTGLQLINATTDRVIRTLRDGDTVSLRQDGRNLNIEAMVEGSGVASVVFLLDGEALCMNDDNRCVENGAPFAMAGDHSGNFLDWDWSGLIGDHKIEAVPCDQDHGEGNCGPGYAISLTVTR